MNEEDITTQLDAYERKLKALLDAQRCFLLALRDVAQHPEDFTEPQTLTKESWNECWTLNELLAQALMIVPATEDELNGRVADAIELDRMMELN